jgi:Putative GTPase activating protein for Arf
LVVGLLLFPIKIEHAQIASHHSISMSSAAEAAVKRLARAPGNTTCPNCGLVKKFGFGTVCMKFLTFVCNECKSSHQAISHRCKSLTMSAWTDEEVTQLERIGGNDVAHATWLATAPPPGQQGRPNADGTSSIDTYKAFIVNVYERKLYYRERSSSSNNDTAASRATRIATAPVSTRAAPPPPPTRIATATNPAPPRAAPVAAPQPTVVVADLLDFGAPAPSVAATGGVDLFADFGPAATTTTTTTSSSAPSTTVFDPFGTASATSSTNQAPSTFSAFPTAATTSSPASSFDPLGHVGEKSSQTKPPVMNNMSNSTGMGSWMGAPMNSGGGAMNGMHNGMGMNSMMNANAGTNPMMNSFGQMPLRMQQQQPMMTMMPNRMMTMPMQQQPQQRQQQQQQFMMGGATAFHNPMSAGRGMMMNQNGFSHNAAPVMNQQHVNPQLGNWNNNTSFNSSMGAVQSNTISSNFGSQPNPSSSKHDPFANLGL